MPGKLTDFFLIIEILFCYLNQFYSPLDVKLLLVQNSFQNPDHTWYILDFYEPTLTTHFLFIKKIIYFSSLYNFFQYFL